MGTYLKCLCVICYINTIKRDYWGYLETGFPDQMC